METKKQLLWGVALSASALLDCNAIDAPDYSIATVQAPCTSLCVYKEAPETYYSEASLAKGYDAELRNLHEILAQENLFRMEDNYAKSYSVGMRYGAELRNLHEISAQENLFRMEDNYVKSYAFASLPVHMYEISSFATILTPPLTPNIKINCGALYRNDSLSAGVSTVVKVKPLWDSRVAKSGLFTRYRGDKAPLSGAVKKVKPTPKKTSSKSILSPKEDMSLALTEKTPQIRLHIDIEKLRLDNEKFMAKMKKRIRLDIDNTIAKIKEESWNSMPAKSGLFSYQKSNKAPLSGAVKK
jgi:hypothetical protein